MARKGSDRRGQVPVKKNTGMIRSFIEEMNLESNYETWVPYLHRGLVGFADLIVNRGGKKFLFEFVPEVKELEKIVKNTKLKEKIFREAKNETESLGSYIVLHDSESNRGAIIRNERLLETQPFGLLFFDGERTVSYSGTKERVPRIFQTKGVELETSALNYLMGKPNHEEIEEAILNLENLPETVDKNFVERVERYIHVKGIPSEGTSSLTLSRSEGGEENTASDIYVDEKLRE